MAAMPPGRQPAAGVFFDELTLDAKQVWGFILSESFLQRNLQRLFGREVIEGSRVAEVNAASVEDVVTWYRMFLGREPESDAAIVNHLQGGAPAADVMDRIYNSAEARQKRAREAVVQMNIERINARIDVYSTGSAQTQILNHIKNVWTRYGRDDAYYSVLTDPKYQIANMGPPQLEEFYNSGEAALERFNAALGRHDLSLDTFGTVLELGCGVGRVGAALARRCKAYIGVDISSDHIALASQRFSHVNRPNGRFMLLSDYLEAPTTFDVFYSIIVLQHNPPPIIHLLLDTFLRNLKVGGIAYFQVPCLIPGYSFSVEAYLRGEGKRETMEVHVFPQQCVLELFRTYHIDLLEIRADDDIGDLGFSNTYLGRKR